MAQESLKKGIFITFEGCEGSGKSTQARRAVRELKADGYDVVSTVEPGASRLGKYIRQILLNRTDLKLISKAELLLFEADRAQHIEEFIRPNLKKRKIVICDRFNDATIAYQGYGLGLDTNFIERLDDAVTDGIVPDLTILLDVDVKTGLLRARKAHPVDRFEKRAYAFHARVRKGYLILAKESGGRIKIIKSAQGIDETYKAIRKIIYDFIERYKRPA